MFLTQRKGVLSIPTYGGTMAYDPGAIDSTLAAAVGDDPALIAELRGAFVASVRRALATLDASDAAGWASAAARLEGLAASFGAVRLAQAARDAAAAAPHDPRVRRTLERLAARL